MSLPILASIEPIRVAPGRYSLTTSASALWKTFPPGTRVSTSDDGTTIVTFPAKSAFSFKDFLLKHGKQLPYHVAVTFFHGLAEQFSRLATLHNLFDPFYDPRNIIVIDGRGYTAHPGGLISTTDRNVPYQSSIQKMPFLPPEVHSDRPNVLTPACGMYTLASLTGASMFPTWGQRMSASDISNQIEEIVTTPLYWCLMRCLEINPDDRVILYL